MPVIKSFRNRSLGEFWNTGRSAKVPSTLQVRVRARLLVLNQAERPEEMNIPGFDFHPLRGKPQRYTVHVNGPWWITFEWDRADAIRVDLEQYH